MKTVFEQLYSTFPGSALDTAISGRWYPIQAPVGSSVPLCVVSIITEPQRHEMSHTFVDVLIEISVVAEDATTMHTISELVFALFDGSSFTFDGYRQISDMEREDGQPVIEDGAYRYIIEYRLQLQKL